LVSIGVIVVVVFCDVVMNDKLNGQQVYVANSEGSINGFAVSAGGDLTELTGSPFTADTGARDVAMLPDGSGLVVAAESSGTVRNYLIGSSGALAPAGGPVPMAGASAVTVSPDGGTAYVGGLNVVRAYRFTSIGALVQLGPDVATAGQQSAVAVSPDIAPTAVIESVQAYAGAGSAFEGGHSTDPDGYAASWSWDFGDGSSQKIGQHPEHVYETAGQYHVTLTVTDNEGCSADRKFTGQMVSCAGGATATVERTVTIADPPPVVAEEPACPHDGNDGFCGTPDLKAPRVSIVGINDGASITTVDAPEELAGFITPDPSGVRNVMLRFTKAAGTKVVKKKAKKKCRKVPVKKGSKKKKKKTVCTKKKKKKKAGKSAAISRVALCDTIATGKNYFIRKQCDNVAYLSIGGDTTFRYSLPLALGTGSYTIQVLAIDNAGNQDVLEQGRNQVSFKIVRTPSNQGGGGGVSTTPTPTPSTPIDDTGSPFG